MTKAASVIFVIESFGNSFVIRASTFVIFPRGIVFSDVALAAQVKREIPSLGGLTRKFRLVSPAGRGRSSSRSTCRVSPLWPR